MVKVVKTVVGGDGKLETREHGRYVCREEAELAAARLMLLYGASGGTLGNWIASARVVAA